MRAAYYAAISFIDYNVVRILNQLENEGILDQTLILFTSDHGEFLGDSAMVNDHFSTRQPVFLCLRAIRLDLLRIHDVISLSVWLMFYQLVSP